MKYLAAKLTGFGLEASGFLLKPPWEQRPSFKLSSSFIHLIGLVPSAEVLARVHQTARQGTTPVVNRARLLQPIMCDYGDYQRYFFGTVVLPWPITFLLESLRGPLGPPCCQTSLAKFRKTLRLSGGVSFFQRKQAWSCHFSLFYAYVS